MLCGYRVRERGVGVEGGRLTAKSAGCRGEGFRLRMSDLRVEGRGCGVEGGCRDGVRGLGRGFGI